MHAFFHHHVLFDFKKAKKLYKEALKRTEFTKGCYNMLTSIYMVESIQQNCTGSADGQSIDIGYLEAKLAALDNKYGHFLGYEKALTGVRDRIMQQVREQV